MARAVPSSRRFLAPAVVYTAAQAARLSGCTVSQLRYWSRSGLLPPTDKWPDQHWMAKLLPAWDDDFRGRVRFHQAFEPLA